MERARRVSEIVLEIDDDQGGRSIVLVRIQAIFRHHTPGQNAIAALPQAGRSTTLQR
jgi:hypothetical protein